MLLLEFSCPAAVGFTGLRIVAEYEVRNSIISNLVTCPPNLMLDLSDPEIYCLDFTRILGVLAGIQLTVAVL